MNSESEDPRTSSRLWVRTVSVQTQANKSRGRFPKGSLLPGPDKGVHLIRLGEAAKRLGRGGVDRFHGIARARDCLTNGNQAVSLTRHGPHSLMPVRQKEARIQHHRGKKGARDNKLQGRVFLDGADSGRLSRRRR